MSRQEDDEIERALRGVGPRPAAPPEADATRHRLARLELALLDAKGTLATIADVSKIRPGDRHRINVSHARVRDALGLVERWLAEIAPPSRTATPPQRPAAGAPQGSRRAPARARAAAR